MLVINILSKHYNLFCALFSLKKKKKGRDSTFQVSKTKGETFMVHTLNLLGSSSYHKRKKKKAFL